MQYKIKYKKCGEYREGFVEAGTFFYALEKIYGTDNPDYSEKDFILLSIEIDTTVIIR